MPETAEQQSHKYWAFISYSHRDKAWADWLHRSIETFKVPVNVVGRPSRDGEVPARLFPVFRDREELPTSADLGATARRTSEAVELRPRFQERDRDRQVLRVHRYQEAGLPMRREVHWSS